MTSSSPEATAILAEKLARVARPGDTIALCGEIGAGKSHLARSLIQARLGRDTEVPSPSYTLVQSYGDDACEIWHADLYRVSDIDELTEIGLEEALASCLVLIEWADRFPEILPEDALRIDISVGPSGERHISFSAPSPTWQERLSPIIAHGSPISA